MGVAIHPELYFEILRPMVKKVAQSDLPFLSYGQKTAIFVSMKGRDVFYGMVTGSLDQQ